MYSSRYCKHLNRDYCIFQKIQTITEVWYIRDLSLVVVLCRGRITFYTEPPEEHTASSHLSAEIVTQLGKEFNIDDLLKDEQDTLKGVSKVWCTVIIIVVSFLQYHP